MRFEKKPDNDFARFIDVYFEECSAACPRIEGIAGKWTFEDLIPGLSDFDTRFLCSDATTDEDFCAMSSAVGRVHLDLCERHPEWVRKLEHLPGVDPTWAEFADEPSYYPEYRQWTIYRSSAPESRRAAEDALASRPWEDRDEYYFLKKFFQYYGPYDRGIDPAINLGAFESKYPLHSRIMHYFNPPLQAAVSLVLRRSVRGKFEALRLGRELHPELPVFDEVLGILDRHYEVTELFADPAQGYFEERLRHALDVLADDVRASARIVPAAALADRTQALRALNSIPISPLMRLIDSSRFCRLFKGRMHFYANAPAHFDNRWLIHNELGRSADMFVRTPCRVFWKAATGEACDDVASILRRLAPDVITEAQAEASLAFLRIAPGTWTEGRERETCLALMDVFDDVFYGLSRIRRRLESLDGKEAPWS